ncbi:MAG: hypothetical protein HY913_21175 [Desulfomonile tiedjei]|nr:hypothetical protein [Desulfomonile tiedjei]
MDEKSALGQMASQAEELARLAQDLYDASDGFPAINRNAKRILASIEMLRINLEETSD